MLSCQYGQKSLRIYSSPLLNQCHEELGRSEDKRLHMYDFSAVVNLFAHLVQHCIFKLCHDKKKNTFQIALTNAFLSHVCFC